MTDNNNRWNPDIIKKINVIKERTWSYTWIHRENSIYLADIYEWVSIIAYSLSFFNGVIMIFPTNLIYIRIFNILLSFGSGLMVFYIKNKKLTETAEKHKMASSKFSNIYNNIERQLSLHPSEREQANHYHRWIAHWFDSLYGSAPDIDPPIIDEYIRKFARKRKINPIEAAEFDRETTISSSHSSGEYEIHEVIVVDNKGNHSDPILESGPPGHHQIHGNSDQLESVNENQVKLTKQNIKQLQREGLSSSTDGLGDDDEDEDVIGESKIEIEPSITLKMNKKGKLKSLKRLEESARQTKAENNKNNDQDKHKFYDYELSRMEMGGIAQMGMGTKCFIHPEDFKQQEQKYDLEKDDKKVRRGKEDNDVR